jgi:glycosyltransferase involved in cell wall biosynthesis
MRRPDFADAWFYEEFSWQGMVQWNFSDFDTLAREPVPLERKNMKIAQIAPLMESVPPRLYGGSERIVSYLTDELVRLGYDVTLFASGDSVSSANLVPCVPMALRLDANVRDPIPYYMLMLDRVREFADEFDILHFHIDQFHFPLFRPIANRTVTTLHGRQDLHDLKPLYVGFSDMPLVSISNDQRRPVANSNFVATVYHGIPANQHKPNYTPRGGYVAFLGRISPEKRPDRAIQIARELGIPLKIAAKVDKVDEAYFREIIAPLLDGPGVEFIGEINEREKTEFLGQAQALLFPIDWPEPFGLSVIEAMACGTPVLAFRCGSVSEIIDPGVTGLMVETMEEAVRTLPRVLELDRRAVRRRFEERFSATRMAKDYVQVYRSLLKQPSLPTREAARAPLSTRAVDGARLQPELEKGMN